MSEGSLLNTKNSLFWPYFCPFPEISIIYEIFVIYRKLRISVKFGIVPFLPLPNWDSAEYLQGAVEAGQAGVPEVLGILNLPCRVADWAAQDGDPG